MNGPLLLQIGLVWGTILGLVFSIAVLCMGRRDPELLLSEYPPDIRARVGPMRETTRRRAKGLQLPLLGALGAVVVAGLWQLRSATGELTFVDTLLASNVMFQVWNLLDLVWLDWFILMTLRPRFMILPGTEGMAGYRNYAFHARQFLRGIVLTFILALMVTILAVGFEGLARLAR